MNIGWLQLSNVGENLLTEKRNDIVNNWKYHQRASNMVPQLQARPPDDVFWHGIDMKSDRRVWNIKVPITLGELSQIQTDTEITD